MFNFEKDATVTRNKMGELVERLALNVKGHDVQIVRFNGNDNALLVKVDRSVNILRSDQIDAFIMGRLAG